MRRVAINGKFLSVPMTGVHRVAAELGNALADIQAAQERSDIAIELWIPRAASARAEAMRLPRVTLRLFQGIPWEQITLPLRQRGALILSLCNIGPVGCRHAITMIHDAQVHLSPQSYTAPFRLWYKVIQPLIGRRQRRILTVSQYSKEQIVRFGLSTPEKVVVIHNGVDHILRETASFETFDKAELAARRYVVALSTTQAHKNIEILLQAFATEALADLTLVLVGSTDEAAFAAAGLAVPPNVYFTGRISDGDLRGLFERALCIAFPSTTEGFGLPPLEAMLVGCPAIVAPCGALPEVCGDAVLYAGPGDAGEWAARIRMLADDPDTRDELVIAGRRRAEQFTWRGAAERLMAVLRDVA